MIDHGELISGQRPDDGDHHIEDSAADAFERPSESADVGIDPITPGSPHQPLLAVFPNRTFCYSCMVAEKLKLPLV